MDDEELLIEDDIEAYCVRCRDTIVMQDAQPVWTRKGLPAMRGECPSCGNTVYRLGKTHAHDNLNRPAAVQVATQTRMKLAQETLYLNFAPDDAHFAEQLAADLEKMGVAVWLHEDQPPDVNWAGGVHPSLSECMRMILVLSPSSAGLQSVEQAWKFFHGKKKPIIVVQAAAADVPDPLRRRPRFDFAADYKSAFRQMLGALNG